MASKKKISTKTLSVTGMMIAITVILAYTPLGLIPLQPISATTTHIPTIIIAILEGPLVGAVVGLAFGLISLLKALTAPAGILDPYFINPLVSVIPRILIGLITGYLYIALKKGIKKEMPSSLISAAVGSMVNTLGSMGMLYVIYASDLTEKLGSAAGPAIWGVITTYGIMEMIAAAIISAAVVVAMKKVMYK